MGWMAAGLLIMEVHRASPGSLVELDEKLQVGAQGEIETEAKVYALRADGLDAPIRPSSAASPALSSTARRVYSSSLPTR